MGVRIDHIADGAERVPASGETSKRANGRYGSQPAPVPPPARPPRKAVEARAAAATHRS